jgi:hypothetical protein
MAEAPTGRVRKDPASMSRTGAQYRNMIFFGNAYSHWQEAIRELQNPLPAKEPIEMPNALQSHPHG